MACKASGIYSLALDLLAPCVDSCSWRYRNSRWRAARQSPKQNHLRKTHPPYQAEILASLEGERLGPSVGQGWQGENFLLGCQQPHRDSLTIHRWDLRNSLKAFVTGCCALCDKILSLAPCTTGARDKITLEPGKGARFPLVSLPSPLLTDTAVKPSGKQKIFIGYSSRITKQGIERESGAEKQQIGDQH